MSQQSFSDVTPYVAAQIATGLLREAGIIDADVEIAPQSMYGNKTIQRYGTARRDGGDGIYFVGDSFKEWLDAQLEGRASGQRARVNLKALLSEYGREADEQAAEGEAADAVETSETDDNDVTELEEALAGSLAAQGVEVTDAVGTETE